MCDMGVIILFHDSGYLLRRMDEDVHRSRGSTTMRFYFLKWNGKMISYDRAEWHVLSSICEFLYLYSYSKLLGKEKGVLCMKMEGDGKIEKVGMSGVSKSSLRVCWRSPNLVWVILPFWAMAIVLARKSHTGESPMASGKSGRKSAHPQQGDRSLGKSASPPSVTFTATILMWTWT